MSLCQQFLSAARQVAKKRHGWTDRACAVFDHGGGAYEVRDYDDDIVWSGDAHCRYCARAQAIAHNAGREVAA